ncbi:MAG: histidine--tRNA ligase [Planctomycetota bacterium]
MPPVKGTRDFYPPLMAKRNWIIDGWKKISARNGFEEYDGPIFEYLKIYQVKSGDEIVEQLFNMTDRGGRQLAIRPEITPTLARMVNQQISSLPRPIKWFSVPRLCRAERPQKGRLREFFQWNIDIIGVDNVLADAEVILCAVDYLRDIGLTAGDVVVKISSRKMLRSLLKEIGIEQNRLDSVYTILDKKSKCSKEAFEALLAEQIANEKQRRQVSELMDCTSLDMVGEAIKLGEEAQSAIRELRELFELLELMGIADYCAFDVSVVRGLAYYTSVVFEIYDRGVELRAICGGGRYDNLLKDFGGPAISATGFGMGDCVLGILLDEKGLWADSVSTRQVDYYVVYAGADFQKEAVKITALLRRAGFGADFSYKGGSLSRQLKQAADADARKCIIVGSEYTDRGELIIKDMATGQQSSVRAVDLLRAAGEK